MTLATRCLWLTAILISVFVAGGTGGCGSLFDRCKDLEEFIEKGERIIENSSVTDPSSRLHDLKVEYTKKLDPKVWTEASSYLTLLYLNASLGKSARTKKMKSLRECVLSDSGCR